MKRTALRAAPLLLVVGLLSGGAAAGPRTSTAPGELRLRPGDSVFWDLTAPTVDDAPESCGGCRDFALHVTGAGGRLRIATDTDGRTSPSFEVFGPDGTSVAQGTGVFSAEVYVPAPTSGRYVVRVPAGAGAEAVRLRARLERTLPAPAKDARALLPNLQLVPPYEFAMELPVAGGRDLLGCNAYEKVEYSARHCLRFSLGPANVGDGPFMLRFPALSGMAAPEPVYQIVQYADGTTEERQAGTALYHKTHLHHHHNGFGSLELFRVTDARRGLMVQAGTGPKQGFCMLDFMIADWRSFRNDPANSIQQDCAPVDGATGTQLGLGRGWADIYTYGLDGNYVEFGDNPDGRYVIRSVADANNDVLETDETDNAGYAYIEIKGATVTVLERGHGLSPWDRRKRLADDLLPSNA